MESRVLSVRFSFKAALVAAIFFYPKFNFPTVSFFTDCCRSYYDSDVNEKTKVQVFLILSSLFQVVRLLRMAGKDSHPEGGKERELRLRHTNKKYSTHNRKKSLRNVIRSQYLKYIGHVCRCPNTMMTEKMLFAKLKRPHKRDPWIDISRGVNVSIEQAQSTLWYIVGSRGVEW